MALGGLRGESPIPHLDTSIITPLASAQSLQNVMQLEREALKETPANVIKETEHTAQRQKRSPRLPRRPRQAEPASAEEYERIAAWNTMEKNNLTFKVPMVAEQFHTIFNHPVEFSQVNKYNHEVERSM